MPKDTKIYKKTTSKTKKLCVHRNNELNEASFPDFTRNEYKALLLLFTKVGCIDKKGYYTQPENIQRNHTLTAKEFSEIFSIDIHNAYRILESTTKGLLNSQIIVKNEINKKKYQINICSQACYCKEDGKIEISFTDHILPYLKQTTEKFTLYRLYEINHFESKYAIRLYELIMQYKSTGWVKRSVDEWRACLGISSNKLTLYKTFKQFAILKATDEIKKYYPELELKLEEVKEKNKVTSIKFHFNPKIKIKNPSNENEKFLSLQTKNTN